MALAIIPKPPGINEPFWVESAQNFLTGAILHFWGESLSFPETMKKIQGTAAEMLVKIISESMTETARLFVSQLQGLDAKVLGGVFAEVSNKIMVFATDTNIIRCLQKSDVISPVDLERGKDIYLCIPEDKLDQWKPFTSLVVNQFLKEFERRTEEHAAPILVLLEEFARFGKVEAVNGLATLRSKKITMCLILQSLAQLDAIYGQENRKIIADNCSYKAILNATDAETQDYFSRLVGTWDKPYSSSSENYSEILKLPTGTSISTRPEEKRIIKPEEFATLSEIVLLTPYGFMRAEKIPHYK